MTLTGDGSGQLILSGTNSYGGGTNVWAGTLMVTNANGLPFGSSLNIGGGAGTIFGVAAETAVPQSSAIVAPVPEPGTLALLVAGLVVALGVWRRRKELRA